MSLSTWKAEFYQLDADADAVQVDDITRTRHSLQKWIGLRPENLERHGVVCFGGVLTTQGDAYSTVDIDSTTCALCIAHDERDCINCPLFKQLGYECWFDTENISPYNAFIQQANPEPMIAALEATLQMLTKGNDNSSSHP